MKSFLRSELALLTFLASSISGIASASPPPASATPTVTRYDELAVMTPTPSQPAGITLRLRTMVRPADNLWVGPAIPAFIAPAIGHLDLSLLDPRPQGGFVATYRQTFTDCGYDTAKNCSTLVKMFDATGKEVWSLPLDGYLSRRDHLEVQDVRYAEDTGTLYFNEACQSYSKEAGGRCSSLVAFDPVAKKVIWRTPSLTSNNELLLHGKYLITGYGFTGERCFVRVIRRKDGVEMDRKTLKGPNYELVERGNHLQIFQPTNFGDANFTLVGFDGDAPTLSALPSTPSTYVPKNYDPPLLPDPNARRTPFGGAPF